MYQPNSTPAEQPKITVISARKPEMAKLRVAAYARVSSDSDDQQNSYIAQVDYYTKNIAAQEGWEMADIYADEGISGLVASKRDDFNRMIQDCRDGKIDRILVKSISRFARNTKEYIQYVRELLRLGISIHFEKENIDTGKMTSEQIATIYGAFSQMESQNHSNNMRISVRIRMEKGDYLSPSMPYGYRLEERTLAVIPEQAEVVRRIFAAYLSGQGKDDIADELNQMGIPRTKGRKVWYSTTIGYILTNISYTGDMVWQKSYSTNDIPFRQVRNKGEKPKYFVENCHEPIVSKDEFQRVQALMESRQKQIAGTVSSALLAKKIHCGNCGTLFRRKIDNEKVYWTCRKHNRDKDLCPTSQIPEEQIITAILRMYHKLKRHREQILSPILNQLTELREKELRSNRKINDIDKEIAQLTEQNLVLVRLKSKGYVDSALYLSQTGEIDFKLRELRRLRRRIMESTGEDRQIKATEAMLDYLEASPEYLEELTEELFETLVENITISSEIEMNLNLYNGLTLKETMERTVR
ncbi:recombinase family protein [Sedimentibacter hydroxybenzoicus DSM 7310]|uniref:Recombinase family protein n=1 Tax=Sedimentibacter hydroxybenzoicus DSM 7310 TaxID=1123245 RepID=A0A974GVK2_SEDHY|nr:recombinase family protein [Sedimentibacter hydroxybenzoicus]NYB73165.1 recombinase family protein [Sedimentibacter hydroxybenzoicus DSM 7310]